MEIVQVEVVVDVTLELEFELSSQLLLQSCVRLQHSMPSYNVEQ